MSEPTKELERLFLSGGIAHDGNKVLEWNCSNIEISVNPAGDIKMDKSKSKEKIDGMVALAMALGCYTALNAEPKVISVYEERGLREL